MPATKTYARKRTTTTKGKMTPTRVASIAKKVCMKKQETKKHSFEKTEQVLNTNSGVSIEGPLNIPSGTGMANRVGHKINPIGLDLRGHIVCQPSDSAIIARVMVVKIKDNLAQLPDDLLEINTNNVTAATNNVSKMYRRLNTDSFEILKSKYINLTPLFSGGKTCKMFKMWIPLKKLGTLTYEGSSAVPPNRNDIAIIVYAADADNDNSFLYELSYNSTFYYKDP